MRLRCTLQFVSCAVLLPVFFSACSGNPQARKQKYFLSGQHYFENGKYAEAAIEFVNAVKVDPNYTEAHHQLAETYLRLQKPEGALRELGRTTQLQPDDYEARIELANLLILGHNLAEASEHIDFLLKQRPSDPLVHSVDSSLLAAQGEMGGAVDEMRKSIALDSGRWQFYLSLALLQVRDAQPDAAEASFQKVIELNPAAAQARLLLGSFYQSHNRNQDAEREFREAIAVDQKSPEP